MLEKREEIEKLERRKDVKGLIKALRDQDSYTRWLAAIALKNIGDRSALPHLVDLLSDENDYVRLRALEAIGSLGGEEAVDHLVAALRDENEHIRRVAADLLSVIEAPISVVLHLLKSDDKLVRRAAAEILDRKGWKPESIEEKIYYNIAKDEWERVSNFKEAINILPKFLKDRSDGVRFKIAEILGEIGDVRAVFYLKKLLNDENKFVRLKAAESIAKLTGSASSLIELLNEKDDQIKIRAIEVIGRTGDPSAIDKLRKLLRHKNGLVRMAAAKSLEMIGWRPNDEDDLLHFLIAKGEWGKIASKNAYKILLELLDDEDENVRCSVVETLGRLRDPRCVDGLVKKLSDESRFVRWRAAEALGLIRDKRALKPLIDALGDECEYVRSKAAEALGELRDAGAIEPLMRAMEDESEFVRWAAAEALWKLRVG